MGRGQGTRSNNTFSIKLDPSDASTLYPTAKHRVHIESLASSKAVPCCAVLPSQRDIVSDG